MLSHNLNEESVDVVEITLWPIRVSSNTPGRMGEQSVDVDGTLTP